MKRLIWAAILISGASLASTYTGVINDTGWQVEESVFACRLSHRAETYGAGVFETRAGESSRFHLVSDQNRFAAGQAQVLARSPAWMERPETQLLGQPNLGAGPKGINLDNLYAEAMLLQLYHGRDVLVSQRSEPSRIEAGELALPVIGFRPAYRIYRQCLANLLPVNFDQVKRTAVYFGSNLFDDLPVSEREKLDAVALYAVADSSVKEVYIDGHTDSVDSMQYNLELSERRAEEVKRYLLSKGVPEQSIISRWHGQRYPIADNTHADGRASNRRVTVRLERVDLKTLQR